MYYFQRVTLHAPASCDDVVVVFELRSFCDVRPCISDLCILTFCGTITGLKSVADISLSVFSASFMVNTWIRSVPEMINQPNYHFITELKVSAGILKVISIPSERPSKKTLSTFQVVISNIFLLNSISLQLNL